MLSRIIFLCGLTVPVLCAADFEATYQKEGTPSDTSSMSIRNGDVLMGDRRGKLLYRADTKDIVAIDHAAKTYMVIDEATAERMEQQMGDMQQQMDAAMQQLQSQMAQMSEEQRAMMQQMLEQRGMGGQRGAAPQVTVQPAGKERVAGVSCEKFRVIENGRPVSEACVAPPSSVGMSAADYRAMLVATDNMRKMVKRMTGGFTQFNTMDYRALDGMPVQLRDLKTGNVATMVKHSDAKLDAAMFRVPQGYERREMMR